MFQSTQVWISPPVVLCPLIFLRMNRASENSFPDDRHAKLHSLGHVLLRQYRSESDVRLVLVDFMLADLVCVYKKGLEIFLPRNQTSTKLLHRNRASMPSAKFR